MMPVDTGGRSHTQEEKVLVGQTGTEEWVAGGIEEVGLCISHVKRKKQSLKEKRSHCHLHGLVFVPHSSNRLNT